MGEYKVKYFSGASKDIQSRWGVRLLWFNTVGPLVSGYSSKYDRTQRKKNPFGLRRIRKYFLIEVVYGLLLAQELNFRQMEEEHFLLPQSM